jgi:methyl-accepting chemotaxis protein
MDLTMTNVWLGILAIISLIQFLMVCAAGIFAYRMYQRAMTTLETVERVHIAPIRARVDAMLDEVQTVVNTVKHTHESVSDALRHVTDTGNAVADAVKSKAWPIVGIFQGLKSAAATVIRNGSRERPDSPYGGM